MVHVITANLWMEGCVKASYSKEVDKFGYTSYAKMDNGAKEIS